jgi:uncharacterized protein with HEPN domain
LPPDDQTRIEHMIEAAETACNFVSGRARADLDSDQMLVFALVRAIEIVGEAASRVSAATRQSAPELPWNLIISMRNRLVHAYFDIDHEIVWKTATQELPQVLPALRALARK